MRKPFIFPRPGESRDDAANRLSQEVAEAEQVAQSAPADTEEVRVELVGAPAAFAELQALAQAAHSIVLESEQRLSFKHGDLLGEWGRAELIDGVGPTPAYYYRWVEPGPTIANLSNPAA